MDSLTYLDHLEHLSFGVKGFNNTCDQHHSQDSMTSEDTLVSKPTMKGEKNKKSKNKQKSVPPLLPPCKVCGDNSTGFHYGATTCEACKGFYRRSLVRKRDYECISGNGTCDVSHHKKNPCPSCRMKKCIIAGMSKTGIRRGRYSIQRKTGHIMEVKGLHTEDLSPAPSITFASKRPPNDFTKTVPSAEYSTHCTSRLADTDAQRAREEFLKRKDFVDAIYEGYKKHLQYPEELSRNLKDIHANYEKERRARMELSESRPRDGQAYMDMYNRRGSDVDYRIGFFQARIPYVEKSIQELVSFAKAIPGFRSIPMADQMTLIKSVQFTWSMLAVYPGISMETGIYTTPLGDCISKPEMEKFTGESYVNMWFNMGSKLCSLSLDDIEMALLTALCVVHSEFTVEDLEDYNAIDTLYHKIGEALYFYTKCHKDPVRFGRIVSTLTELRTAEDIHIEGKSRAWKFLEEMEVQYKVPISIPPLILELWAGMVPAVNPDKVKLGPVINSDNTVQVLNYLVNDNLSLLQRVSDKDTDVTKKERPSIRQPDNGGEMRKDSPVWNCSSIINATDMVQAATTSVHPDYEKSRKNGTLDYTGDQTFGGNWQSQRNSQNDCGNENKGFTPQTVATATGASLTSDYPASSLRKQETVTPVEFASPYSNGVTTAKNAIRKVYHQSHEFNSFPPEAMVPENHNSTNSTFQRNESYKMFHQNPGFRTTSPSYTDQRTINGYSYCENSQFMANRYYDTPSWS